MKFLKRKINNKELQDAVVVGKEEKRFTYSKLKKMFTKRRYLVARLLLILLILLTTLFLTYFKNDKTTEPKILATECSDFQGSSIMSTSQEALLATDAKRLDRLAKVTERIKEVPKYESDPNCVYPILQLHISRAETSEAKEKYKLFEQLLNDGGQLDQGFLTSFDEIKQQIEFLTALDEQADSNYNLQGPAIERAEEN